MTTAKVQLVHLAHARSGDKGNRANVGIIAYDPAHYSLLKEVLTPQRVKEHFGEMVKGEVERFELPNLHAMNFVLHDALEGGGTVSRPRRMSGPARGEAALGRSPRLSEPCSR